MKKLFFAIVIALFTLSVNAQTTNTVVNDAGNKPNTTTTTMGKGLLITTTGQDVNGNTWILTQNQSVKGKLKNWSFVVISKNGQLLFSDNGKRGSFERTGGYMNGGWIARLSGSGSPAGRNYGTGAGVVNGGRITW
ncbi:MAG: hypothetical protein KBC44_03365 [Candidatus Pacebacteria bacterium]|nr:hypothetical protein [Candidatus Paceibacterota bacterium]